MALGGAVASHFEAQARACDQLGSPFTARICRLLAILLDDRTATGRKIIDWHGDPRGDALALRICGGLHRLVIDGRDRELQAAYPPHIVDDEVLGAAVTKAISLNDAMLSADLVSPPQTNEIARSGMLLPGFLAIARATSLPLELCEIGASAGLNLLFDQFGYRYGSSQWGDQASPVQLAPEVRGDTPPLDGSLSVSGRIGCDIAPVDITSESGRLRLRSYVWADQPLRHRRLDGALELAGQQPLRLEQSDAAEFTGKQLSRPRHGSVLVLVHSIMWQYMPRETRDMIDAALEQAGSSATDQAPIAHLRMEPLDTRDAYATLSLTLWPGGETQHLARCDYHGRWIEWIAGSTGA